MPGAVSFDFSDQQVFVTGANGGIGGAIAEMFLDSGASVVLSAHRDLENLKRLEEKFGSHRVRIIRLNLADSHSIVSAVNTLTEHLERLDVLVNCAGISRPMPLQDITDEICNEVMWTNVLGAFLLSKGLLPLLSHERGSSIVNVASMSGHEPYPGMGMYSASKAALIMLTRQMAIEWAPLHIRVNAVSPGLIVTPLTRGVYEIEGVLEQRRQLVPTKRIGEPRDVAEVVGFLCSESASYINGQSLLVDGGLLGTIQNLLVGRPESK